jgi:hypothetical protein
MIISHEHRFIFLKTRKTAGTSIEIALSRYCGDWDVITPIGPPKEEALRKELSGRGAQNFRMPSSMHALKDGEPFSARKTDYGNHMPARKVRAMIGPAIWDEYFKFCFERNPWDRAISQYYSDIWSTRNERRPRPSLLEYLRSTANGRLSNFWIYSIHGDIAVDHVGLYENLNSELERITALLNLPGKLELSRAKGHIREDRRHYREVMGREERSIIERACAREIAHFGYSF